jgi:hypothetical protein
MKTSLIILMIISFGIIALIINRSYYRPQPLLIKNVPPDSWHEQSFQDWKVSLPFDGWTIDNSDIPEIVLVAKNDQLPCMVVGLEEAPDNNLDQVTYVIDTLRILGSENSQIITINQVSIGKKNFSLILSKKDGVGILSWVTLHHHRGFNLSCVGEYENCQSIANTLLLE